MYDLAIVGTGFWGSAAIRIADTRGISAVSIDDMDPRGASRNAAGIVTRSWYKQHTVRSMTDGVFSMSEVDEGIDWFASNTGLQRTTEEFYSYQRPNIVNRADTYLLPGPDRVLVEPGVVGKVTKIEGPDPWRLTLSGGDTVVTRKVILALGYRTQELCPDIGVVPLHGRALVVNADTYKSKFARTYLASPYKHLTVRPWGDGEYRVGDTTERRPLTDLEAEATYKQLLEKAERITGDNLSATGTLHGIRPVLNKMYVGHVDSDLVCITGGHRVGLALAYPAAKRALSLLGF
jgi:glycine/D-amino acid oxidase-like deaminating enzyme